MTDTTTATSGKEEAVNFPAFAGSSPAMRTILFPAGDLFICPDFIRSFTFFYFSHFARSMDAASAYIRVFGWKCLLDWNNGYPLKRGWNNCGWWASYMNVSNKSPDQPAMFVCLF